ncbi:MAG TPA: FliH/SctL family protein [Stellaceae bacterium]|jgi:flagellar assembly protein FliH|nr:FliH/SctL family protein [Stellaceae bacterium]
MSRRLNLTEAVVVPWPIPDIDAVAPQAEAAAFLQVKPGPTAPVEAPAPTVARSPALASGDGIIPAEIVDATAAAVLAEERERALQESRKQGHAEGFMAGQRAAERQFADQLQRFDAVIGRLGEPMRSLERPVEEAVIALALEAARWVIGNEITMSRDHLIRLVRDAVAKVPIDVGTPSIVLNPADAELIRSLAPDFETNGIALEIDDTIEPGGCLVVANGAEGVTVKDRRWHPRARQALCEVDLTLASRWRNAMFVMFEGEDA